MIQLFNDNSLDIFYKLINEYYNIAKNRILLP